MRGHFTARHDAAGSGFEVTLTLNDLQYLTQVVQNIRRVLDLDADILQIETVLCGVLAQESLPNSGLRLLGIWDPFEAGVRAILGQQVSVAAARNLVQQVVAAFNPDSVTQGICYFPSPAAIAASELAFLRIPGARKASLRALAAFASEKQLGDDTALLLELKGIGPWTVDYIRMRGLSDPDIFLAQDLGVKKALQGFNFVIDPTAAAPWRSYLTFHLWHRA